MEKKINLPAHLTGLTDSEVLASAKEHGLNKQTDLAGTTWWKIIFDLVKEPMLILLIAVAVIYFILGQNDEAYFMLGAIFVVTGISFYQDNRSRVALEALRALNAPNSRVIRNGIDQLLLTTEIVPGDLVIIEEGGLINADGIVVYSHDLTVNESSLTGEAQSVYKSEQPNNNQLYSGTMVSSGMAVLKVEHTGNQTKLGQLGTSLTDIKDEISPLQLQIQSFVRKMSIAGIAVFLLVWLVSFLKTNNWLDSLLNGLTLAMSILPEEIPVAFATFMALGSRRLIRDGILVKKTRIVETLGGATVICTDKTGTITENRMSLQAIYSLIDDHVHDNIPPLPSSATEVIETAMWASEPVPFDPMEKTLHDAYEHSTFNDRRREFSMIHEYPLEGVPPMMTHIFENKQGEHIIAAKGAPEAIIQVCKLSSEKKNKINRVIDELATKGYRLLGVSKAVIPLHIFPPRQQDISFTFSGLVAFYDPPKEKIREVFDQFYTAGVDVKIITGDNALTTKAIAEKTGLKNTDTIINGHELLLMKPEEQLRSINNASIFTRMFPEVKLAAINALRANNQVVAMIGDGVNDGPALKAADIGIAMGKKGTEIAKSAADLILLEDDLGKLVHAI
ncbi:MAG: HAD-IC family P-type ATPase, partial [Saprospiraceae bacterium]